MSQIVLFFAVVGRSGVVAMDDSHFFRCSISSGIDEALAP
jgi:hypothetical protein